MKTGFAFRLRRILSNQYGATQQRKWEVIERYRKQLNGRTMVESGTLFGDTVFRFKDKFEKIISIELSEELAQKCLVRFQEDSNVTIVNGNSADVLPNIL